MIPYDIYTKDKDSLKKISVKESESKKMEGRYMRKFYRFVSVMAASLMLFSMAGCGSSGDTEPATETASGAESSGEDDPTTEAATEAETEAETEEETTEDPNAVPEGMQKVSITDDVYGIDVQFLLPDYGWKGEPETFYANDSTIILVAEGVGADAWNMKLTVTVNNINESNLEHMLGEIEKYDKYSSIETTNEVETQRCDDAFGISGNVYGGAYVDDYRMGVHFSVNDNDIATNKAQDHPETLEVIQSLVDTVTFEDTTGGTGVPSDAGGIIDYTATFKIPDNSIKYNDQTLSAYYEPWCLSDSAKREIHVDAEDPNGHKLEFTYLDPYDSNMYPNIPTFESDWPYVEETIGGYTGYTRTIPMGGGESTKMEFIFDAQNGFYFFTTTEINEGESDMVEARAFLDAILSAAEFTQKDSRSYPTVTVE